MFGGSKHKYENLRDTAEDGENSTQYAPKSRSECLRAAIFGSVTPWVISTVVFSFLSAFLATKSFHPSNRIGTFETGFSTDIGIIGHPPIRVVQHQFTGSPRFDDNGVGYETEPSKYAGVPRPEIDAAWQDLIGQRYFIVTPHEAQEMFGPGYKEFELKGGKYAAGIDVLHQLHCLNTLRKYADFDYYGDELKEEHGYTRLHIDHCVDQIRQSLQCSSDRTPIPTRWYPKVGAFVVTNATTHTCRDFDGLRQWMIDKKAF